MNQWSIKHFYKNNMSTNHWQDFGIQPVPHKQLFPTSTQNIGNAVVFPTARHRCLHISFQCTSLASRKKMRSTLESMSDTKRVVEPTVQQSLFLFYYFYLASKWHASLAWLQPKMTSSKSLHENWHWLDSGASKMISCPQVWCLDQQQSQCRGIN